MYKLESTIRSSKLRTSILLFVLLSLSFTNSTTLSLVSDTSASRDVNTNQTHSKVPTLKQDSQQLEVSFYEIFFDLDAANSIFNSIQNISIFTVSSIDSLSFYLHSDLIINEIKIWDAYINEVSIDTWQTDYDQIIPAQAGMEFVETRVDLTTNLPPYEQYYLHLKYSIKPEAISVDLQDEMFRFVVSEKGTRGLAWPSGLVPLMIYSNRYANPHSITIKHPKDQSCLVSGNQISTIQEGDYIIDSYLSQPLQPTAPSFACDNYQVISLAKDNISVEFLYTEDEVITQEILEIMIDTIILFQNQLGDTGDRQYQFGYVDVEKSRIGGTIRRNTFFMRSGDQRDFDTNLKDMVLFITPLLHEISHNWNGFVLTDSWIGNDYFLWYQEGGANFLASWACEMVMGPEAASIYRKYNLERYDENKGYNSQYILKTIPYWSLDEISDVMIAYEYAGMIWEQLALKIGIENVISGLSDFVKKYWINEDWTGFVTINDLFDSLEKFTEIDVETYLDQWVTTNPVIKLQITDTHSEKVGSVYNNTVEINVESDKNFEILTSIGYKINSVNHLIDINFTKSGKQTISFTTDVIPDSIVIDPEYRVPRIGIVNSTEDDTLVVYIVGASLVAILIIFSFRFIRKRRNK